MIIMFIFNPNPTILIFALLCGLAIVDIFETLGFADAKVFIALSLTLSSFLVVVLLLLTILISLFITQIVLGELIKRGYVKRIKTIPLIPIMLFSYLYQLCYFHI